MLQFTRFRLSGILIEMEVQMASTNHQNWSLGRPKMDFFEIWMDFGNLGFLMFLLLAKCRPKNPRKPYLWRKDGSKGWFLGPCHNPAWTTKLRFWPFWLILHSFVWQRLTPASVGGFWRPLDFEGVPNSTVFVKKQIQWEKECPRRGCEKTHNFDRFLMPKLEARNCKKICFPIIYVANWEI